jgi:tetratricopeptide (TPR) repeat protein
MLLRDAGASAERVSRLLELALELDPNLPGLQQFLGHRALEEGNYELAIQRFSWATLLQPQKSSVWLGLAYAYRAAGNREAARAAAQQSANLAREEDELRMAEAALENLNTPPDAIPSRSGPKTIVPDTWRNREGDRRLEGTLVRMDCEGSSAKLHLRTAGVLRFSPSAIRAESSSATPLAPAGSFRGVPLQSRCRSQWNSFPHRTAKMRPVRLPFSSINSSAGS